MRNPPPDIQRLIDELRRHLPLAAHLRDSSNAALPRAAPNRNLSDLCRVTNVFDAGDEFGLMCQLEIGDDAANAALVVIPITHLAFDRRRPIARDIADYRRRRFQGRIA